AGAMYWTWELGNDGGFGWVKHPFSGSPLYGVSGAGGAGGAGGAVYVSRQVSGASRGVLRLVEDGGLEEEPTSPGTDVWDLWVSSDGGHVFGIESGGGIAHRRPDGTWHELFPPELGSYDLNAIYGQNGGDLWVVGQATEFAQQNGLTGGIVAHLKFNP
ncbi:MAG: hypothetical protein ACJ790_15325, partial [Myxococcaceae bacterium]